MIIVSGARIAGCLSAALLAKDNEDITLIDRTDLSEPPISISLICPDSLARFDLVGFGEFLDDQGFQRIRSIDLELLPGVRVRGDIPASFGRNWGYAIKREVLDNTFRRFVLEKYSNIRFLGKTSLLNFRVVDNSGEAMLRRSNGDVDRMLVKLLIGADGRTSTMARLVDAFEYDQVQVRTAFYYRYYRVKPNISCHELKTFYGCEPAPNITFVQPAENGDIGVGLQLSEKSFRNASKHSTELFDDYVSRNLEIAKIAEIESPTSRLFGLLVPSMFKRKPFGSHWALVGDAGLHINPITGQGITCATTSAVLLAQAVGMIRNGTPTESAFLWYQQERDRKLDADYSRAAAAADIDTAPEDQIISWFRKLSESPELSRQWLKVLTNAIPPFEFFENPNVLAVLEQSTDS